MDETSVPVIPPAFKGVVMKNWRRERYTRHGRFNAGRNKTRLNLTYVAFVSDDYELNTQLPQFIIGGAGTAFHQRDFAELFQAAPDTVYLVKRKTGWVNEVTLAEIYKVLAGVLKEVRPNHTYVLAFDCAPQHLDPHLFRILRWNNIFPLVIPAKVTWLLQPLDVYCFRYFKEILRRRFYDEFAAMGCESVRMAWVLKVLYSVIEDTIQRIRWPNIFKQVGLGDQQAAVAKYIKTHLECERIDPPEARPPRADELGAISPARRPLPVFAFQALPKPKAVLALAAPAPLPLPGPPPPPLLRSSVLAKPIAHSTRSRSRAAAAEAVSSAAASSSGAVPAANPPLSPWPIPLTALPKTSKSAPTASKMAADPAHQAPPSKTATAMTKTSTK